MHAGNQHETHGEIEKSVGNWPPSRRILLAVFRANQPDDIRFKWSVAWRKSFDGVDMIKAGSKHIFLIILLGQIDARLPMFGPLDWIWFQNSSGSTRNKMCGTGIHLARTCCLTAG